MHQWHSKNVIIESLNSESDEESSDERMSKIRKIELEKQFKKNQDRLLQMMTNLNSNMNEEYLKIILKP